jgi:hypothetical protein
MEVRHAWRIRQFLEITENQNLTFGAMTVAQMPTPTRLSASLTDKDLRPLVSLVFELKSHFSLYGFTKTIFSFILSKMKNQTNLERNRFDFCLQ